MIDINELRRLAQAATPGPWWVNQDGLNHGFERGVLEINAKDWHALAGAWAINGAKPSEEGAANAAFIAAANPAAISELLARLEAAESDGLEQARLNGMGGEREAALLAKLEAAEKERDALRAKIEEMERQEPVAWLHESRCDSDVVTNAVKHVWGKAAVGSMAAYSIPLYTLPGAQPAPSFADAYQGAMEEVAIWKKRALEAEDLNRKFITEINGPTHMGEPAQPAPSVPDGFVWPECPKRRQSHVLFDDGYEEGWAACISTVKAMLAAAPKREGE